MSAISPHRGNGSSGNSAPHAGGDSLFLAADPAPCAVRPDTAAGALGTSKTGSGACLEATASEARRRLPDPSTTSVKGRKRAGKARQPTEAMQAAKRAADDRYARMLEQTFPLSWLVKWIEPAHESALQAIDRVPLNLVAHSAWEAARDAIFKAQGATKELLRMAMHATAEAVIVDGSTVAQGKNWLVPLADAISYDIYCVMLWIWG